MTKYIFSSVDGSVNLNTILCGQENLVDYLPNYLSQLTEKVNLHDIYFSVINVA